LGFVFIWEGKGPEAEALWREGHKVAIRVWQADNPETLHMAAGLVKALMIEDTEDKLDEAEGLSRRNLKAWLSAPEVNQYRTDECRLGLGCVLRRQGKWSEAENVLQQVLKSTCRYLPKGHPYIFWQECNLGAVLEASGKKFEAATHLRNALDGTRKVLSSEHPFVALALYEWAEHLLDQGELPQAEEALREVSRIPRQNFPPGNLRPLGESLAALGWVLTKQGRAQEGEPFLQEGLEICRKYLPEKHWATAEAKNRLGGCLAALGQFADAEKLLVTSYHALEIAPGVPPPRSRQALERVIELDESSGQADKAAEWRTKRQAQAKVEKKAEGKK